METGFEKALAKYEEYLQSKIEMNGVHITELKNLLDIGQVEKVCPLDYHELKGAMVTGYINASMINGVCQYTVNFMHKGDTEFIGRLSNKDSSWVRNFKNLQIDATEDEVTDVLRKEISIYFEDGGNVIKTYDSNGNLKNTNDLANTDHRVICSYDNTELTIVENHVQFGWIQIDGIEQAIDYFSESNLLSEDDRNRNAVLHQALIGYRDSIPAAI